MPATPSGLILDGKVYPCASPVYNWHDTGLETKIGGNNKRRKPDQVVDLFGLHWTGGVGDARQLFRVLNTRELGVEYFWDYNGDIYQFCDPVIVNTADIGYVNPRSFGGEVRCLGIPRNGKSANPEQKLYNTVLRGRKRTYVAYTDAQNQSVYNLLEALRAANHPLIKIPPRVPVDAAGKLITRTLTRAEIAAYSGTLGHYHVTDNKADPGTAPLQYLLDRGYGTN